MRALWLAVLLTGAAAAAAAASPAVTNAVELLPGFARVGLQDASETPFSATTVRLLALPPGASEPQVRLPGEETAGVRVSLGEPMTARGVRLVPVRITREPGRGLAPHRVDFEVHWREGDPRPSAAATHGLGFFGSAGRLILQDGEPLGGTAEGSYLIVTVPEFVPSLAPFVAWKREMGYEVAVVTTAEAGTTNDAIRAYVQSLYDTAEVPPQYLLLVGDVEQIPGFDYHQSISDLPYSLLDGPDFLPDLEVGRFSARTTDELDTIVAKTLRYEQDPDRSSGDEWFSRALIVAGNMGSSTPVPTSLWCREQLLDPAVGFAEVDTVFYPPYDATGPFFVRPPIDEGVSIVSYRGWALGTSGWDAPQFTVDDIPSLSNGWKLPVVFSFVCLNGNFAVPECFGEAWIRAGSAAAPKGAVAFLGNSEHWSHTRFNDAAAIGVFDAMRNDGVRGLGQLLNACRYEILEQFPDQLTYDPWTDEAVEFYFYIYSLLGDPSLELLTAAPRTLSVAYADSIPVGSTMLQVTVREQDGSTPVPEARVGITQAGNVLGSAFTDVDGVARILTAFEDDTAPVRITVTGRGLAAFQADAFVFAGEHLALTGVAVDDDGVGNSDGNGDGVPNPGETLELVPTLHNRGANPATGVFATLGSLGGGTVIVGGQSWPDLAPGATASPAQPYLVRLEADAEDGQRARFRLTATTDAEPSVTAFDLTVRAPALRYDGALVGGDGVLDPGESALVTVTLLNDGSVPAGVTQAVLRCVTPELALVTDSLATFDPVPVGVTGTHTTPFTVAAADTGAIGSAAAFLLELTTPEGWVSETSFSLVLGDVNHRAPLGPDAYGYWAYDNSDTDYPDTAPVYEWIPCSPAYGGAGTDLALGDNETAVVPLPFSFQFYGQSYDSLLVSDNGWASFEIAPYYDFYNWNLPSSYGAGALLAPFWDNLDPTKEYQGVRVGDGVYTWHDAAGHRFVVEWSRLGNLRSQHQGDNRPDWDDLQTFELVLFDPAFHPTATGDGIVRFQYKQIVNNDSDRMYSTVGIENEAEDDGLQYTYTNLYPEAAAPLSSGLAIEFRTDPPRYRPFRLLDVRAQAGAGGVALSWLPCDDRPLAGYRVYRRDGDGAFRLLPGGTLGPDSRGFLDETAAGLDTRWEIGVVDPAGRQTLFGPFPFGAGGGPALSLALRTTGPNPAAGPVALAYSLPVSSEVQLRVFSVDGRRVRTLVNGPVDPGWWSLRWDGRDDAGRIAASGVYFVRLETTSGRRSLKLTRIR